MQAAAFAAVFAVLVSGQAENPPADDAPLFDVDLLRENVSERLLRVPLGPSAALDFPAAAVLDHLWKSNGGALIPRAAANADARRLATELVQRIDYEPATQTISWPVFGFADPASLRFSPGALWSVMNVYFQDDRFETDDVRNLEKNFLSAVNARPALYDPLTPPVGFGIPADDLLCRLGYMGSELFVYSPANCFDAAFKCYRLSWYDDALVFLSHAIAQTQDARYYYVRGTIEMLTGRADDAKMSALGFLATAPADGKGAPSYVFERVNGAASIQFRDLAKQVGTMMSRTAPPPNSPRRGPAAAAPPPPGNLE